MLSRGLYRLNRDTVSLETTGSRKQIIRIPKDGVIEVLNLRNGPESRQMAEVRWLGKTLEMFAEDVELRGEVIRAEATAK